MKRLIATAAVLAALVPAPLLAQTILPPPGVSVSPPAPRPAEVARARTEADRLIAQAEAEGIFENVTDGEEPTVRHRRSGLVCGFRLGERDNRVLVFEQNMGMPRGDDVGCNMPNFRGLRGLGMAYTIYATRYRGGMTAEAALARAASDIRQRWPGAAAFSGERFEYDPDRGDLSPLPRTLRTAFSVQEGGAEYFTQATVAEHGGWIFKQRFTGEMSQARDAQEWSSLFWNTMLRLVIDNAAEI